MTNIFELLSKHLQNPQTSWSMGSYGAVAEFFQESGEATESGRSGDLIRITPRGGIRIERREDVAFCAFENTGHDGETTQQHIALCLPVESSRMSVNDVLTEIGPDTEAVKEDDRDAVLFDLGVSSIGSGCFQLDFCVRTDNPDLIGFCRQHCGSSIFEHRSPVFPRLLDAQPHRVVITRLGRIEVYQAIGREHTDNKTPEGPHTHLLPELLRLNRTHSANTPIKDGWAPCAFLYPDSPVLADAGEAHRDS